jgi:hypothetical protein
MTMSPLSGSSGSSDMLGQIKNTMDEGIASSKAQNALFEQYNKQMEALQFDSNIENSRHAFAKDLASKLAQA